MNYRHGQAKKGQNSKEYRTWGDMISRCENPSVERYPRYGGRGIKICERWRRSFADFFADVGAAPSPELTLDRIDNNGNYEPGNIRWATRAEQTKNGSRTRWIEFRGERRTICEWADHVGVNRTTLQARLDRCGWSVERALTTPTQ